MIDLPEIETLREDQMKWKIVSAKKFTLHASTWIFEHNYKPSFKSDENSCT